MIIEIHTIAAMPGNSETTASVSGDTLIIDGEGFDFSDVHEGDDLDLSEQHPFVGNVHRRSGEIHCAILWRYDPATADPAQGRERPVVALSEGPVPDPVVRRAG